MALNLVGGLAVLTSYYLGVSSPHAASGAIWGGVPEDWRSLYQLNMLLAAAGYFPFTWLLLFSSDPERLADGRWPRAALPLCYALVLFPSAAWLPLTELYIESPSAVAWWAVKLCLAATAVGSLGIFASLGQVRPAPGRGLLLAARLGAAAFCLQTVVLDAIVWVVLFP